MVDDMKPKWEPEHGIILLLFIIIVTQWWGSTREFEQLKATVENAQRLYTERDTLVQELQRVRSERYNER